MRRSITVLSLITVALVFGVALLDRTTIVRAVAAFTSRTHLIVREDRVKQLSGSLSQIGPPVVTVPIFERLRDGSRSEVPYQVPGGMVFVLTDVSVLSDSNLFTDLRANGASRYGFPGNSLHLVAGLCFSEGTTIDCVVSARSGVDVVVEVLGYEVEAAP